MDLISVLYLAIVTFQFLIFDDGTTLGGNVGLVISQCLILTGMTQYGVRQSAEVASQMTSVERVLQYTKLEKEGPFESLPANKPNRDWPQKGAVEFEKVYLRYVPTEPPVLKNLNIKIEAGQKVISSYLVSLLNPIVISLSSRWVLLVALVLESHH